MIYFPVTQHESRNLCPGSTISPGTPTLCPLAPTLRPFNFSDPAKMSVCAYAKPNTTSTENSGPYVVSNGQTYYHNRAYISIETAYASNTCGYVGRHHPGTILTLMSSEVYSIGGYHHDFKDVGYQVNFADFTNVPEKAYYMTCEVNGPTMCTYSGAGYTYGTDFINGIRPDLGMASWVIESNGWIWDEAYRPTLLVPLQIRELDPAW